MPSGAVDVDLSASRASAFSKQPGFRPAEQVDRTSSDLRQCSPAATLLRTTVPMKHAQQGCVRGVCIHDSDVTLGQILMFEPRQNERIDRFPEFYRGRQVAGCGICAARHEPGFDEPGVEIGGRTQLFRRQIIATCLPCSDEVENWVAAGKRMDHVTILSGDIAFIKIKVTTLTGNESPAILVTT